jgi:protein involved in polysaccharide export with SLBB domain
MDKGTDRAIAPKRSFQAALRLIARGLSSAVFVLLSLTALAQSVQLTPQQEAMLNQLPPAQRQQAMDALRQLNRQRVGEAGQTSISEELSPVSQESDAGDLVEDEEEEPKAGSGSRLVINFTPREGIDPIEERVIENDAALDRLRGSHYFELDEAGVGLTEQAIQQRLGAEPALKVFDIVVALIGVESVVADALEPFGYDVFETRKSPFQPVTSGPVPPDYVLGPGDSIRVQLFGNVNGIYEFEVTRDGILNLPQLGPITVAGLPFSEFREDLNRRVEQMLIGTQVSVTMGQLRTIRIFVLGDVNRPGSYVVSSLATISSALYYSGGISDIGSLRNIQLKRNGNVVSRLDLYALLLRGDTSGDKRLQPGDVIFVPPIGDTAGIGGAVRRPAVYELRGETSVSGLVGLAGGLSPEAFPAAARIERIDDDKQRTVVSVDVESKDGANTSLSNGDILYVPKVLAEFQDSVTLLGHVQRPGVVEFRPGMRLIDLLPSANHLLQGADTGYILIRREDERKRAHIVSANLREAWTNPGSAENLQLQARDTVHVFSLAFGRQRIIKPLLEELELQSSVGEPFQHVSVSGTVKAPGPYPLEPGMRVSDLIRAGGDLSEEAYTLRAELARYEVVDGEFRTSEVIDIDLGAILLGDQRSGVARWRVRFSFRVRTGFDEARHCAWWVHAPAG